MELETKKKATLIKILPISRQISPNDVFDSLIIWYRDENGKKKTRFIDRAQVPYYIIKNKESEEAVTPPMFIERDKVEEHFVYSDMLYREIALRTDSMSFYQMIDGQHGSRSSNMKNLLKHNLIYNADMDIADRYIKNFNEEFEEDKNYSLKKCYMDIEVELRPNGMKDAGYIGFPEEENAPCPINVITLFDEERMTVHSFVLRNPLNPLVSALEKDIENFKDELKEAIRDRDGLVLSKNNLIINFYNSEEEVIENYISTLHKIDPDFLGSWNQCFDIITIQNRLKKLYSRKKVDKSQGTAFQRSIVTMCDEKYFVLQNDDGKEFYITPKAYYKANKDKPTVDRIDNFTVLDGINYFDQLFYFANIRKSSGLRESYTLDAIANEELGKEKLDYSGTTLKELPWIDFKKFLMYNIQDVILLHLLEKKNLDMDMVQRLQDITNTRKEKVFKKTISLKNFVCKFAEEQGFVMGNNKNAQYGDQSAYFEREFLNKAPLIERDEGYKELFAKRENYGAYVGDPLLNEKEGVPDASGNPSMFIFRNVFDEDFSSLYPSIIRAFNLDKNTQVGKFFLKSSEIKNRLIEKYGYSGNMFSVSKEEEANSSSENGVDDIGPSYVDSLMSHNWTRIGEKYFNLPSAETLIEKFLEEENKNTKQEGEKC